ncbi:MAG: DUF4388 domain-containing protein [Pseudomonadota bacterium]
MIDDQWIADQLKARGLVTENHVQAAQSAGSDDFCFSLISSGSISETDLLKVLSLHFQTRYVSSEKLSTAKIPQSVLDTLPSDLCERLCVLPVRYDKQTKVLSVVTPDPSDAKVEQLLIVTSKAREIRTYVALRYAVEAAIRKYYKGDIHAFARAEKATQRSYSQMLDIYDQRLIDLGGQNDSTQSVDLVGDLSSGHHTPPPSSSASQPIAAVVTTPSTYEENKESSGKLESLISHSDNLQIQPQLGPEEKIDVPAETFAQTVAVLINSLEMGQGWRQGHSAEIARLVEILANRMGLPAKEILNLRVAAYLHEFGKPTDLHLTLPRLAHSKEKHDLARRTYLAPLTLLENAHLPESVVATLSSQYERPDGKGIPGKLAGQEIPLGARILSVVDAFCDFMSNPQAPGGRITEQGEGLRKIREGAAQKLLDANAVEIFCQVTTGDALRKQLLGERRQVILIDRDGESATVLELKLVAAGYDVKVFQGTAEAAREVLAANVDLVLTEVDLEPVDGFGFLKRLRSDSRTRHIPVMFLSEKSDAESVNRGFELGALDYIVKPYNPDLLLAKMKRAIGNRPPVRGSRGVTGSLMEMSLPDLMQILSAGQKSGLLRLRLPDGNGEIFFDKGRVVDATYGNSHGEEAVYKLVPVTEGEFSLDPNIPPPKPTINMSTETLVLEAMRRFDEKAGS